MAEVLRGVRVVELASWTYVPSAGAALADWGADVIKVEDVKGGDPGRALVIGGFTRENARADVDFILEIGNRGKRSIAIDIKSDTGREYLGRLLATADVFLTNWLPAALERARLTVEEIRALNPNIIIARGTGTGVRGPDANKGGFDAATYLSRGGVAYTMTPFGTETPAVQGPGFGDLQGGMTLAGGVCAALFHRERTGEPSVVDSSLLAQAMWSIAPSISVADLFDIDGIPGAPPGLAINPLVNRYKTRDNRWIQLVFLQPDRFWAGFCERIGLPELATDERFVPSSNLIANAAEACALVAAGDRSPGPRALAQGARRRTRRVGGAGDAEGDLERSSGRAERIHHRQRRRPRRRVPDRGRASAIQRNAAGARARPRAWTAHRGDPVGARPRLGRHLGSQGQRRDSVGGARQGRPSGARSNR